MYLEILNNIHLAQNGVIYVLLKWSIYLIRLCYYQILNIKLNLLGNFSLLVKILYNDNPLTYQYARSILCIYLFCIITPIVSVTIIVVVTTTNTIVSTMSIRNKVCPYLIMILKLTLEFIKTTQQQRFEITFHSIFLLIPSTWVLSITKFRLIQRFRQTYLQL